MSDFSIRLSPLDEKRFSVRTAQIRGIALDDQDEISAFCTQEQVQLAIARVDTSNLDVVQALEDDGYRLMDTLVYYAFKFAKKSIPDDTNQHQLRLAEDRDSEEVTAIATESFKGYYGHYHADPRLDNNLCDAVYIEWATKSVTSPDFADAVLVVEDEKGLNGFATLRMNTSEEGEGVLFGVAPHAQGQGIYRSMMIHGMQWCQQQQAQRMVVSTQITNVAVQKVWARVGFEFDRAYYTFHKWFA